MTSTETIVCVTNEVTGAAYKGKNIDRLYQATVQNGYSPDHGWAGFTQWRSIGRTSSWGYDQTNIDFYFVTKTTKSSAWIVPMSSRHVDGDATWAEHVAAGEPLWFQRWCECRHLISSHSDYGCSGPGYGEDCQCRDCRPLPNVPKMHRIRRWSYGGDSEIHESLTLTSYSSASLWEGGKLYASHYA